MVSRCLQQDLNQFLTITKTTRIVITIPSKNNTQSSKSRDPSMLMTQEMKILLRAFKWWRMTTSTSFWQMTRNTNCMILSLLGINFWKQDRMTQNMQEFQSHKLILSWLMERSVSIMSIGSSKFIEMKPLKLTLPRSKSKSNSKISVAAKEMLSQLVCSMLQLSQEDNKSLTILTSVAKSLNKASPRTNRFLTPRSLANPNLREERTFLSSLAICLLSRESWSLKSRRDKFNHTRACQSARCYSMSSEQLMYPSGSSITKTMTNTSHKRENKERETKVASRNMMTFSRRSKLKLLLKLSWSTQRLMRKSFSKHKVLKASIQNGTKSLLTPSRLKTRSLSKRPS